MTIDLSDLKTIAALREARDAEAKRTAREKEIAQWDRNMTRAFKGIVPRSTRMVFMRAQARRAD